MIKLTYLVRGEAEDKSFSNKEEAMAYAAKTGGVLTECNTYKYYGQCPGSTSKTIHGDNLIDAISKYTNDIIIINEQSFLWDSLEKVNLKYIGGNTARLTISGSTSDMLTVNKKIAKSYFFNDIDESEVPNGECEFDIPQQYSFNNF